MNKKQEQAIKKVKLAFEQAGLAGLSGGIFDGAVCFWPDNINIEPGPQFFTELERLGSIVRPGGIWLDGGAGV